MHPIARQLLDWYRRNARDLPWRDSRDPYAIWVSEIMLQQTRVETVIPYYQRWMDRFPTIEALAEADQDEVLNLWEGLGYYRRARYLHQAARQLAQRQDAELPRNMKALRELPGIGEYTAAAIGSIAFDQDAIALDGNLKRVLARLFNIQLEVQSSPAKRKLRQVGLEILPQGRASEFNQALMDLGALICIPKNPDCPSCPLNQHCLAYKKGVQAQLPVKETRDDIPLVGRAIAIVTKGERVLVGRRPEGGLLGGLWEFPGLDLEQIPDHYEKLDNWIVQELGLQVDQWQHAGSYRHAYSHFKVQAEAYYGEWTAGRAESGAHSKLRWVTVPGLDQLPMGKVDRSIAVDLAEEFTN